jgi:hypothetical protein
MHFWVVSVLQNQVSMVTVCYSRKTLNITCCLPKNVSILNYIYLSQKTSKLGGISVPQLQGFDAGSFLHKWHAFGGESGFRRNNASILRNLP